LLRGTNQFSQSLRKHFPQPRPASENIAVCFEARAIGEFQAAKRRALQAVRQYCKLLVFSAAIHERIDHSLAADPGLEISALRLEDSPVHVREVYLRPALLHRTRGEFLKLNLSLPKHAERAAFISVILTADHPKNAAAMQELPLPAPLVLIP